MQTDSEMSARIVKAQIEKTTMGEICEYIREVRLFTWVVVLYWTCWASVCAVCAALVPVVFHRIFISSPPDCLCPICITSFLLSCIIILLSSFDHRQVHTEAASYIAIKLDMTAIEALHLNVDAYSVRAAILHRWAAYLIPI